MCKTYTVVWAIEVDAESPVEAAVRARLIQRDPDSQANSFDVREWRGSTADIKVLGGFQTVDLDWQ